MKTKSLSRVRGLITTLLLACAVISPCAFADPQLPEFTYQGRLSQNSLPANGNFDLSFALFDAESAGAQVGATINEPDFPVSD